MKQVHKNRNANGQWYGNCEILYCAKMIDLTYSLNRAYL